MLLINTYIIIGALCALIHMGIYVHAVLCYPGDKQQWDYNRIAYIMECIGMIMVTFLMWPFILREHLKGNRQH